MTISKIKKENLDVISFFFFFFLFKPTFKFLRHILGPQCLLTGISIKNQIEIETVHQIPLNLEIDSSD